MKRKAVQIVCAVLMILGGTGSVVAGDDTAAARNEAVFDELIRERMSEAGLTGVGAALIVDRRVVWSKGYGFADRERGIAFTPDTLMNVGSITKTVTGVAMMRAVELGKLDLDADINRYLPFRVVHPRYQSAKITLRQLATHTSGIADRWDVYAGTYHYGGDSPDDLGDFLQAYFTPGGGHYSAANFVDGAPGTLREYSNIGAALAGYIVERVTDQPLNDFTREQVFKPLGMHHTGWFLREVDAATHARLYVSQNGLVIPIPLYGGTTYPDGGVRTTVSDLARLFIALLGDGSHGGARILEAASVTEMTRFQFTDANRPANFPGTEGNSGLFWRTKFNGTMVGHGGNDPGIQTEMLADLGKKTGVILFVNTSVSGPDQRAVGSILEALVQRVRALDGRVPAK